jgi:hypothetical protein
MWSIGCARGAYRRPGTVSLVKFLNLFLFLPIFPSCSHEFCRCSTRLVSRLCINVAFDNSDEFHQVLKNEQEAE